MADDVSSIGRELNKAHELAERLYQLQKEKADTMLAQLTYHGETLNQMKTDVALIKTNTDGLPARVLSLENLKFRVVAYAFAGMFLLWALQYLTPYLKK